MLVKKLYKHEHLQETIQNLFKKLDLTGNPQLPRAKSTLRTDKRHYRDILSPDQAETIKHILPKKSNGVNTNSELSTAIVLGKSVRIYLASCKQQNPFANSLDSQPNTY